MVKSWVVLLPQLRIKFDALPLHSTSWRLEYLCVRLTRDLENCSTLRFHLRLLAMSWYKLPSSYAQKMKRLSCKIFGEYYKPPMPEELAYTIDKGHVGKWSGIHSQNQQQIGRQSALPFDLDSDWNPKYYPAHPQMKSLVHYLRLHGLFRYV